MNQKTADDPPEKPETPQAERCVVSDTTVEALAPLLLANPRGLLLARDKLAGWIGSFDRYAGGKGGRGCGPLAGDAQRRKYHGGPQDGHTTHDLRSLSIGIRVWRYPAGDSASCVGS